MCAPALPRQRACAGGGAAVHGGLRAAGWQAAARRYRTTCVSRAKSAHVAPMARQCTQIAGKRPGTGDHAPPPPSRRTLGAPPQSGSIKGKLARERVLQPRSRWPRPGRPKRPPAEIPRDREVQQPLPPKRRPGARPQRSTAVGAQYRRVVRRAVCPAARAWCTGALPAAGRRAAPLGPIMRTLRRDDGCSPLLSPRAATHLQPPRGLINQQLFCTFLILPVFYLYFWLTHWRLSYARCALKPNSCSSATSVLVHLIMSGTARRLGQEVK